jgi:hypothetical protein
MDSYPDRAVTYEGNVTPVINDTEHSTCIHHRLNTRPCNGTCHSCHGTDAGFSCCVGHPYDDQLIGVRRVGIKGSQKKRITGDVRLENLPCSYYT